MDKSGFKSVHAVCQGLSKDITAWSAIFSHGGLLSLFLIGYAILYKVKTILNQFQNT